MTFIPFLADLKAFKGATGTDPKFGQLWDAQSDDESDFDCYVRHSEAQLLCATQCPRLTLCATYLQAQLDAQQPALGVWAAQINPSERSR